MKRFLTNKYPVVYGQSENNEQLRLAVGTCFTIVGINANMFELEPIKAIPDLHYPILVDAMMLTKGFNEQEHSEVLP